ncbi:MAG: hypothetical protein J0M02_06240 [Planctomycetes bacterium]|nr:hypothetical protein [Planctomycetota bacterium]
MRLLRHTIAILIAGAAAAAEAPITVGSDGAAVILRVLGQNLEAGDPRGVDVPLHATAFSGYGMRTGTGFWEPTLRTVANGAPLTHLGEGAFEVDLPPASMAAVHLPSTVGTASESEADGEAGLLSAGLLLPGMAAEQGTGAR